MELTDKDLNIMERYYNQTLSETEKQTFEERLKTDADFHQAVNEYQATLAVLNTVRERGDRAFLKEIDASMPPFQVAAPVRRLNRAWWAMAAVGLVLIVAGIWQFGLDNTEGGTKLKSLASAYFEPYPTVGITMGNEKEDIRKEALHAYEIQNYKKAIPLLQQAFEAEQDSMFLFYQSIGYIADAQSQNAIPILEKMKESVSLPREAINWYLGIAYFETNQKEKSLLLIQQTAHTEGGYQRKAQELLKKIKN